MTLPLDWEDRDDEVYPWQHAVNEPCVGCAKPLSRYNPFTYCAACRLAMVKASHLPQGKYRGPFTFPWERVARRKRVRQGSLLELVA